MNIINKEKILVFNKIDKISKEKKEQLVLQFPKSLFISAIDGTGKTEVINIISKIVLENMITVNIKLPYSKANIVHMIHEEGEIINEKYSGDNIIIEAKLGKYLANRLKKYCY